MRIPHLSLSFVMRIPCSLTAAAFLPVSQWKTPCGSRRPGNAGRARETGMDRCFRGRPWQNRTTAPACDEAAALCVHPPAHSSQGTPSKQSNGAFALTHMCIHVASRAGSAAGDTAFRCARGTYQQYSPVNRIHPAQSIPHRRKWSGPPFRRAGSKVRRRTGHTHR